MAKWWLKSRTVVRNELMGIATPLLVVVVALLIWDFGLTYLCTTYMTNTTYLYLTVALFTIALALAS